MKNNATLAGALPGALLALPALAQNAVRSSVVRLGPGVPGVLYEPVTPGPRAAIGLLVMHPSDDYLQFTACTELAQRGYRVLCANVTTSKSGTENDLSMDRAVLDATFGAAWQGQLKEALEKYDEALKYVPKWQALKAARAVAAGNRA